MPICVMRLSVSPLCGDTWVGGTGAAGSPGGAGHVLNCLCKGLESLYEVVASTSVHGILHCGSLCVSEWQ